jgi:phosphoribosylformylglycinamidine synthase
MCLDLNIAHKNGLTQLFDSTIGVNTVLAPLGGKYQLTKPECMAALIPSFSEKKSETASMMAFGFNPEIGV